jgi:hypothetical protein
MPRMKRLENMTHGELAKLRPSEWLTRSAKVSRYLVSRRIVSSSSSATSLVYPATSAARMADILKNPSNTWINTWTGRGRMARWLVAATRGGKAKKEDYPVVNQIVTAAIGAIIVIILARIVGKTNQPLSRILEEERSARRLPSTSRRNGSNSRPYSAPWFPSRPTCSPAPPISDSVRPRQRRLAHHLG